MAEQRPTSAVRRALVALTAGAVALSLAACGSRLDPDEVARLNGQGGLAQPGQPGQPAQPGQPVATAGDATTGGSVGTGGGTTGGDGATGGDGSGGGTGTTGGGAPEATGANAAAGGAKGASCEGFENQTGVTDKEIVLANASDISGPVPGLFQAAQDGLRAYAAFFNASGDICGRKIKVLALDSRTDSGADQQAYARACDEAFAAVGSMSAFDAGGAATAEKCGLPDLRSTTVNPERTACETCFSAQAVTPSQVPTSLPRYFASTYPDAVKAGAVLYINAGAAPVNAKSMARAWDANGIDIVYEQGIDTSEFNYAPYVQQLKSKNVRWVQYLGPYQNAVRLAQAMKQQGYKPDIYMLDATAYDARFVESGGDAVEGVRVFLPIALFERPDRNREVALYMSWLQQVSPGAAPNFYGLFAWSAARLFVQEATRLGGRLGRASLVQALRRVDGWTANGLHAPMAVGAKRTTGCQRVIVLKNGRWVQESRGEYMCAPTMDTGIGG